MGESTWFGYEEHFMPDKSSVPSRYITQTAMQHKVMRQDREPKTPERSWKCQRVSLSPGAALAKDDNCSTCKTSWIPCLIVPYRYHHKHSIQKKAEPSHLFEHHVKHRQVCSRCMWWLNGEPSALCMSVWTCFVRM